MDLTRYNNCMAEIERCTKLYSNFKDAEPFISGIHKAAYQFFKDNEVLPLSTYDPDKSTEMMKSQESLALNPVIKTADFVELFRSLGKVMQKTNPGLKATVRSLNKMLDQLLSNSEAEIGKAEIFDFRDSLIKEGVLQQDMATFLFSFVLSSFYRQYLKTTAEVLRTDFWERGDCPLCGEKPHYGRLRPDDGAKQLECWLCGARWLHTRIKCPYCDNTDVETLGYFTAEDNEKVRVNYCQQCCLYHKIIDARKFRVDGELELSIHNLASLDYDFLARREGYSPGSGLEWVNREEIEEAQD